MSNARFPQFRKKSNLLSRKEESKRIAQSAMDIYLALSIAVLADTFGFGQTRIDRFKDRYLELAESLGTGQDTLEQIKANIYEVFGVRI